MIVKKNCRNCSLEIRGNKFLVDLMLLPFDEFDVILGMNWLITHEDVVS